MGWVTRDERGWKIKNRFFTFHPVSYGTATLARASVGFNPEGRRLMCHYFPVADYAHTYHDHPWSFRTFVLWGKYVDQSIDADGNLRYDVLTIGSTRHRHAHHRHKTRVLKKTVTLVFTQPASRRWCEGTAVDWKCEGDVAAFNETLGHIPPYETPVTVEA